MRHIYYGWNARETWFSTTKKGKYYQERKDHWIAYSSIPGSPNLQGQPTWGPRRRGRLCSFCLQRLLWAPQRPYTSPWVFCRSEWLLQDCYFLYWCYPELQNIFLKAHKHDFQFCWKPRSGLFFLLKTVMLKAWCVGFSVGLRRASESCWSPALVEFRGWKQAPKLWISTSAIFLIYGGSWNGTPMDMACMYIWVYTKPLI